MEKIKKLNVITGIIAIGFIIALIYHFILGNFFHLLFPYNTFLFIPKARFSDFTYNYNIFQTLAFNPYVQWHLAVNYFPFGMLTLYLFRLLPFFLSFILYFIIVIGYFAQYTYQNIKKIIPQTSQINILISFVVISFLSYPFLFVMDRGNNDAFVFIFTSLFIYFFVKEKYLISALILAIPIAMKGYFVIFIALFLATKKYREAFYCLLTSFILTFISLILAKGCLFHNISWFISKHMLYYKNNYIIHNDGLGWGASLFGIIKVIIFWLNDCIKPIFYQLNNSFIYLPSFICEPKQESFLLIEKALKIFTPISAIMILAIMIYCIFAKIELWKKVLLLFICSILFTPVSGDYKLINLFIPLWLFINSETKSKTDLIYIILFGLILIPKNYIQFFSTPAYNLFSISIILNPLILVIMAILIITENLKLNLKFFSKN